MRARSRCGPKLLLLDEPAAGLTHGEIEDLKALIRLLADNGVTVILVEHHVEMVMTVSDHVTVLDYGRVIASGSAAQVQDNPQVIEAYFGTGGPNSRASMRWRRNDAGRPSTSEALLKVDGLKVAYGRIEAVRGVDLEVRAGEFVGIIGSNGAGKTSALRAIAGVVAPAGGSITFDGTATTGLPSHAVVARGIAMVPEGRQIFADQTVEDNLILGAYLRIGKDDAGVKDDMARVFGLFPLLRGAERATGRFALGRRAADAGDRARPSVAAQAPRGRRTLARARSRRSSISCSRCWSSSTAAGSRSCWSSRWRPMRCASPTAPM